MCYTSLSVGVRKEGAGGEDTTPEGGEGGAVPPPPQPSVEDRVQRLARIKMAAKLRAFQLFTPPGGASVKVRRGVGSWLCSLNKEPNCNSLVTQHGP